MEIELIPHKNHPLVREVQKKLAKLHRIRVICVVGSQDKDSFAILKTSRVNLYLLNHFQIIGVESKL